MHTHPTRLVATSTAGRPPLRSAISWLCVPGPTRLLGCVGSGMADARAALAAAFSIRPVRRCTPSQTSAHARAPLTAGQGLCSRGATWPELRATIELGALELLGRTEQQLAVYRAYMEGVKCARCARAAWQSRIDARRAEWLSVSDFVLHHKLGCVGPHDRSSRVRCVRYPVKMVPGPDGVSLRKQGDSAHRSVLSVCRVACSRRVRRAASAALLHAQRLSVRARLR
jgi:hypothetical protein